MSNDDIYKLSTYNYTLPKELIAQYPIKNRDESKLLCYNKTSNEIKHKVFHDLPELLTENDVLILNNTKVIPARFYAKTEKDKEIEILLVSSVSPDNLTWKILANPKKHLNGVGALHATPLLTISVVDNETIKFKSHSDIKTVLEEIGQMPLPPYIKRDSEKTDFERYQTVFAKESGAVAAPTAALHFTEELLNKIKEKGVEIYHITLHVGPGTFLPVRTDDIREHKLIPESFYIGKETWEKILSAKKMEKELLHAELLQQEHWNMLRELINLAD